MNETNEPKRYHVNRRFQPKFDVVSNASDEELQKWATDPNCLDMELCARTLAERLADREKVRAQRHAARDAEEQRLSRKRQSLQDNPFDPRTEISADAKRIAGRIDRIVTHLWILFVLLPVILGLLYALLTIR
jgi:hypothetical protein